MNIDIINNTKLIINTIGEITSIIKKTFKKPLFITRDGQIIKINKFLNSYGNYNRFWNALFIEGDDINVLKEIYFSITGEEQDTYKIYYCLVGKVGYIRLTFGWFKYFFKYLWSRKDLNLIVSLRLAWNKAFKYTNHRNYYNCIDVYDYFNNKDYYDRIIADLFYTNKIDRLNLYTYSIQHESI